MPAFQSLMGASLERPNQCEKHNPIPVENQRGELRVTSRTATTIAESNVRSGIPLLCNYHVIANDVNSLAQLVALESPTIMS